jgi:hypothetical protein
MRHHGPTPAAVSVVALPTWAIVAFRPKGYRAIEPAPVTECRRRQYANKKRRLKSLTATRNSAAKKTSVVVC